MNVYLTFDIEVWCGGWKNLDAAFPSHFQRYVFGRSARGDYALPKTLEILDKHGLKGIFFVEPLFAARFGLQHLETIVQIIRQSNQEIQLHIHPEWIDEISPPILENSSKKRPFLFQYSLEEQIYLLHAGKTLLEKAGSGPISAFRAGSFAANGNTLRALHVNGFTFDSSFNRCFAHSGQDLRERHSLIPPFYLDSVTSFPIAVFRDGFGKERHAQIGACSYAEIRSAIVNAHKMGLREFVLLSHNFEMLKPFSAAPSSIVVKRFENICRFLADNKETYPVGSFRPKSITQLIVDETPKVSPIPTCVRYLEQLMQRLAHPSELTY